MRILKGLMFIMLALVVLALGIFAYFFATAKVTVERYDAQGVPASAYPEQFAQIQQQVAQQTFEGTLFQTRVSGSADAYAFITFTLEVNNQCLVPIDMVEVQVVPDPSDVLQLGDREVHSLGVKTKGYINATILTAKDSHSIRELILTYYVWGVSFSLRRTFGA
ncbi:MAG: hypothetical protein GX418_15060 [Clostridiales bacterium]|nr:hypothetical protein [Clostridiales bacterium]